MRKIYLDHAATTPAEPEVVAAMLPYFNELYGNPSSIHSLGQEARLAVEESRAKVAALIGARLDEIIFTGSGSEADNLAIIGTAYANEHKGDHIVTSCIEHHAVLEACRFLENRGFRTTYVPVDRDGLVDPQAVHEAITDRTILISLMHANNEVGTIQPIADMSKITQERGVYFHTDGVQSAGHIPLDVDKLGVDLLAMSAHKLYGPKGVGALYVRRGTRISSFLHGGGQERGLRASTENVPGIVGFGKAAEIASRDMHKEESNLTLLRDALVRGLHDRIDHIHLNGHATRRLPNNVNVSVEFVEGEALAVNLDLEGIAASTGSACSSKDMEPSHVLTAMGIRPDLARGSLRFTLGKGTTEEDVQRVLVVLPRIVDRLRALSPLLFKTKSTS